MTRKYLWTALAGGAVAAACSFPTEGCGCPPARGALTLQGTLLDGRSMPVAGATVYGDGVPATWPTIDSLPNRDIATRTDGAGRFTLAVYSNGGPGVMTLRTAAVLPGDSVPRRLPVSTQRFTYPSPTTLTLTLQLP